MGAIEVESEVEASPGQNPAEMRAAAKWFQARSAPKPLALAQQQLDALDLIQQSIQQQQQQQQQPQDVSRQTSDSSKEWREPYLAHLSEKLGWSRDRNVHASGSASLSGQSSVSHDDENSSVDDSDLSSIPLGQPFDDAGLLTPEERALTDPAPREPSALPDSSCEANGDASTSLTVVDVQNQWVSWRMEVKWLWICTAAYRAAMNTNTTRFSAGSVAGAALWLDRPIEL